MGRMGAGGRMHGYGGGGKKGRREPEVGTVIGNGERGGSRSLLWRSSQQCL